MIKESYNSPKFSQKFFTRLCFMLYQNLTITRLVHLLESFY